MTRTDLRLFMNILDIAFLAGKDEVFDAEKNGHSPTKTPKRSPSLEAPSNFGSEEPRSCAQIGETDARPAEKTETDTDAKEEFL